MSERIINKALKVIEGYIDERFSSAYVTLDKEMHGRGCGCRNCARTATKEMNEWGKMIAPGNDMPIWRVDKKGRITDKPEKGWTLDGGKWVYDE